MAPEEDIAGIASEPVRAQVHVHLFLTAAGSCALAQPQVQHCRSISRSLRRDQGPSVTAN